MCWKRCPGYCNTSLKMDLFLNRFQPPHMLLIDTHAHIYLPEFDADRELTMANAGAVERIYMPNIDLDTIQPMLQLQAAYPGKCFPMMGLHPCSVKEDYKEVLRQMERILQNGGSRYYGIGETGLDYYWDLSFKEQQIAAFEQQILWAKQLQLPVIIHSRNSIDDCIQIVEKHQDGNLSGIFHCFPASATHLERAIATGLMIGIGGVLTFKNGGLDRILSNFHLKSIVLETDAPYLAPAPHRGKRNEPAYIRLVAIKLSEVLGLPLEVIAETTTKNADAVFQYGAFRE